MRALGRDQGWEQREQEQLPEQGMVSLVADVPEPLLDAMHAFIDRHPHWDQYRLFQAALAGFLVQHGSQSRAVTRCYLANLFPGQGRFAMASAPAPKKRVVPEPSRQPEARAA